MHESQFTDPPIIISDEIRSTNGSLVKVGMSSIFQCSFPRRLLGQNTSRGTKSDGGLISRSTFINERNKIEHLPFRSQLL